MTMFRVTDTLDTGDRKSVAVPTHLCAGYQSPLIARTLTAAPIAHPGVKQVARPCY